MRKKYTRNELIDIGGQPVILNLGCGRDKRGIGIDVHYNPDIEYDLNNGIPVENNSVNKIIAEHILEHLENPSLFFREVRRVLRKDGEMYLEVPNAGYLPVRLWITQDIQKFWEHKIPGKKGHWLARLIGNTEPERTQHLTLWTKGLLEQYLERFNFDYIFTSCFLSKNLSVEAGIR